MKLPYATIAYLIEHLNTKQKLGDSIWFKGSLPPPPQWHECRNVTATLSLYCSTHAFLCSSKEGSCYVFRSERVVANFYYVMMLFYKVIINQGIFNKCTNKKCISIYYKYINLWENGQISYFNCNFGIFTEIFTISKTFKHLIINTHSENRVELFQIFWGGSSLELFGYF